MAITIDWDQVNGAELDQHVSSGQRIVRSGFVKGLTTTVTTPKLAMLAVMNVTGVPQFGEIYDAAYPQYRCVYRVVRGIESTGGRMARIFAHYETALGGTPIETFSAEDGATLSSEPTTVFPGQTKQLLCSTTSTSPNYSATTHAADDRPITANYPRSLRSLVLAGLFANKPSIVTLNATNSVNNATWQGLGIGRWRCEGVRASYSNRDGLYRVTAGFLSKGDGLGDDWSTYEIPIDPKTGQPVRVDQAILTAEQNKPYVNAIMSDKNSLWHVGLYTTRNFSAIFGDNFGV